MKRIAVVEDEVYMREELCDMLQKDGYLVEAITEYEDAARLLAALRPDLVILDLNLPEISGFQICQEPNGIFQLGDCLRKIPVLLKHIAEFFPHIDFIFHNSNSFHDSTSFQIILLSVAASVSANTDHWSA